MTSGGIDTGYGVDVAITRADDLDKKLLALVEDEPMAVLDLGCGAGGTAVRLALAGASVTAVDMHDFSANFTALRQAHSLSNELTFIAGDIRHLEELLPKEKFDYCLCQRTIHYLPYQEALICLKKLRAKVRQKLFISVTGVETDIGEHYPCSESPLVKRYCSLNQEAQTTFSIREPLCLYTPEEFTALLLDAGWQIEECWVSAFGNIKAVCT